MKIINTLEIAIATLALACLFCSVASATEEMKTPEEFFISTIACDEAVIRYEQLEMKRRQFPEAVLLQETTDTAYLQALEACGLEDKFVN